MLNSYNIIGKEYTFEFMQPGNVVTELVMIITQASTLMLVLYVLAQIQRLAEIIREMKDKY